MRIRDLIHEFETTDTSGDSGGTGDVTATPDTPVVEAGTETSATTEATTEEPWALSRDDWETTQQTLQGLAQFAPVLGQLGQMLQRQPEPVEDDFEFDPLDPQSVREAIRAEAQRLVDQRIGPVEQFAGEQVREKGEAIKVEQLDALAAELEYDFDRTVASQLAEVFFADNPEDPQAALRQAAELVASVEKAAEGRGAERVKSEWQEWADRTGNRVGELATGGGDATELAEIPTGAGWGVQAARMIGS